MFAEKREIDEDLLFSLSILRLWRTGADKYIYSSPEDGDCDVGSTKQSYGQFLRLFSNYFQLSEHLQAGEHGLSIDTDVALWIEYREYNKRPDLRQVMDFVIVNSEQHSEFDEFKRAMTDRDCVLLSNNALLDYWNELERSISQSPITVYGQEHHKLHYTEMDQLIEWVMKQREKRVSIIIIQILFDS